MHKLVAAIEMMVATTAGLALLKLLGVLGWSWWVVTSPVWLPWSVTALAAFCLLCYLGLTRIDRLAWLRK